MNLFIDDPLNFQKNLLDPFKMLQRGTLSSFMIASLFNQQLTAKILREPLSCSSLFYLWVSSYQATRSWFFRATFKNCLFFLGGRKKKKDKSITQAKMKIDLLVSKLGCGGNWFNDSWEDIYQKVISSYNYFIDRKFCDIAGFWPFVKVYTAVKS